MLTVMNIHFVRFGERPDIFCTMNALMKCFRNSMNLRLFSMYPNVIESKAVEKSATVVDFLFWYVF